MSLSGSKPTFGASSPARLGSVTTKAGRDCVLPLLAVIGVSAAFEALFLRHGLNLTDEGWPLQVVMALREGATLYEDVSWVFPPGHLMAAWIGSSVAPPGVVGARVIYALFAVAACASIYLLGRRLMRPEFALLAGLLVAVAAPYSHMVQVIFGYRYLVFSVLALLAFDRFVRDSRSRRWLVVSGAMLGLGMLFRLEPVFAAGCGIGVAIAALDVDPRRWLRDWAALALGLVATAGPAILVLGLQVGFGTLWTEVVVRPATMLALQSLPMPDLPSLGWALDRIAIRDGFVSVQFRLIWVLYAIYAGVLGRGWWRSRVRREPFDRPLLLAVVIWGGVFFSRSLTRSDEPHLDSVIPPVCLLFAIALDRIWRFVERRQWGGEAAPIRLRVASVAGVWLLWVLLLGSDTWLSLDRRGVHPLWSLDGTIRVPNKRQAMVIDSLVFRLRDLDPSPPLLDMSASPMFHVLSGRRAYGPYDVVMPGAFLDESEEQLYLERVRARPPVAVVWPQLDFDGRPESAVEVVAPSLSAWVQDHYERRGGLRQRYLLLPREGASQ